jgi:hypothetical protein
VLLSFLHQGVIAELLAGNFMTIDAEFNDGWEVSWLGV